MNNPLRYTDPTGEFITWSISKRGFSIGINFALIGIQLGFCKKGYYSVYLVIDQGKDYHWYRQDKGGTWSHKPGITPVKNAGYFIGTPFANYGNYKSGGILLWIRK